VLMSLWSFQGVRELARVSISTSSPPAENTAVATCLAGRTDLSKLNSALAASPTEVRYPRASTRSTLI
jgi:hypothetical protein